MFEDLFDTQEEIVSGVKQGQVQSAWDRMPRSCADTLPMPEHARQPGYPIGLKNQGATCYLNSLLQILFHTPQLRKTILDLPLCNGTPEVKTQFLNASKHRFMYGFQRLFSEMSLKDSYSLSTQYMKEAFGWEGSEHVVQHDIQQAMKIILDTFQRALQGTQYEKNIKELFKGISSRYKTCRNCTVIQQKLQQFYGLNLQVHNINSLQQSIMNYLNVESMQGDNQIFCQTCQSKQNMWLGSKLKALPNILVFTLQRFTFDYEKFDRIKLSSLFTFNLEYNLQHLLEQQTGQAGSPSSEYQLYGILIHSGSAHSGHYYCYIRDLMQQSDWQKGLKQAEQKQKLQKEKQKQKQKENEKEKEPQSKRQKTKQPEHPLKQPQNKKLLQNWFQLDDSRVTAIDAKKITTKYQGSASAYILFYRRRGIDLPTNIVPPTYLSSMIKIQNELGLKQRQQYEIKKNQIIINIDGNNQTLSLDTKISDVLAIYCPFGYSLVNQAKHNGLPYYPKQLSSLKEYPQSDTIKSLDIIHESAWKKYQIDTQQYQQIQPNIEQSRMPFEINIFYNDKNQKMLLYQNQVFYNLRLKIEKKYGLAYQQQIIKLVTAYRQYFVTDQLINDQALLTKLGFVHQCQAIVKKLEKQQGEQKQQTNNTKQQQKIPKNTICFIIQRDDIHGIKRMYFNKEKTLEQLFNFVVESQVLDKQTQRRFRNLTGDRLFYNDQYKKKLDELGFTDEIIKLRIQRGQVPIKGDICILARIQSKFAIQSTPVQLQYIFDPNATVLEVKNKFCQLAGLNSQIHRLYQTDWMGQPSRCVTRQKLSIFDSKFGKQQKICIRDSESPIGSELVCLDVFETKLGTPQDIRQSVAHIKIQQFKTLNDLKSELLKLNIFKSPTQSQAPILINQIRVRQIKKDYTLGPILRENARQLKNYTFNTNKIAVQVLKQQEQLNENQIVLVLKKRNKQKRLYEGNVQLVYQAGKNPTILSLQQAVRQKLGLNNGEEKKQQEQKLRISKYVHYDFEWVQISQKYIDKFIKSRAKNEANNKKKQGKKQGKKDNKSKKQGKNQQKDKKQEQKKVQQKVQEQKKQLKQDQKKQEQNIEHETIEQQQTGQQKHTQNTDQKQIQKQIKTEQNTKVQKTAEDKKNTKQSQNKNKNKQPKQNNKQGNKEGNKQHKNTKQKQPKQPQPKKQQCLNLRKPPYLLKDGDWIGYSYGPHVEVQADDLQTDEDLSLKLLKRNQKAVAKQSRGPEKVFQVKTDF